MFKTRRQARYKLERDAGFCAFEAKELSRIPLKVPYMDVLIQDRHKRFVGYMATEKASRPKFEKMIKQEYVDKRWSKKSRTGLLVADTWVMLRDFESRFRAKHPAYTSPWEKRRKAWKDFRGKLEATYLKYPRSMPVRRIEYLPGGGAKLVE